MMEPLASGEQICSRAGCTKLAAWNVNWRNPKIHPVDRVKVWLACDVHRQYLFDYLATRSFPVTVTPLAEHVSFVPDPSSAPGIAAPDAP